MFKGIAITVLALLSSVAARPEPQFILNAPFTALSAAYSAPTAPYAPVLSAVPALPAVPAVPAVSAVPAVPTLPETYPGVYPVSVNMYSYAYRSSFSEVPVPIPAANYISDAYRLPYRSYNYAPAAAYIDLAYRK